MSCPKNGDISNSPFLPVPIGRDSFKHRRWFVPRVPHPNYASPCANAGAYKRLRRLRDRDIQFQLKRLSLSSAQERTYKKLKNEVIGEVRSSAR